jgi:hypothetical protein
MLPIKLQDASVHFYKLVAFLVSNIKEVKGNRKINDLKKRKLSNK